MGRADQSMSAHYRERISDDRLKDVADFVHDWLFLIESAEEFEALWSLVA